MEEHSLTDKSLAQKEKIEHVYSELQGCLSQATKAKTSANAFYDAQIWNQYNEAVDELNNISGNNYDRFRIHPETSGPFGDFVRSITYRSKLAALILRLHNEFFSDAPAPFSDKPATDLRRRQQQSRFFQMQMILEIQSKIDEKIPEFNEGSKEKEFLEKAKASLASIKSATQLVSLLLKTGRELDLTIEQMSELFD
ncbi:MAG: hypothetical protein ACYS0I_18780 [Planctomycetota bacterium]|jgi:hypothetical protein